MSEILPYYGGLRLDDLLKASQYGTSVKIVSGRTGRVLLRDVRNGDQKHDYYWGIEIDGIHSEMYVSTGKDYVRSQIVCYTNEDNFYKRKNGAFFEERQEAPNA